MSRASFALLVVFGFVLLTALACTGGTVLIETNHDLATAKANNKQAQTRAAQADATHEIIASQAAATLQPLYGRGQTESTTLKQNILLGNCTWCTIFTLIMGLILVIYWARRTHLKQRLAEIRLKIKERRAAIRYELRQQNYLRAQQGRPPRDDSDYWR